MLWAWNGLFLVNTYISMYARTNRCYNERGSRINYVRSSIPHCIYIARPFPHSALLRGVHKNNITLYRVPSVEYIVRKCTCIGVYRRMNKWQKIVNWKAKLLSRHCRYPDPHSNIAPRKWVRSGSFRVSLLVVRLDVLLWPLSSLVRLLARPRVATSNRANCGSRHRVSMFRATAPSTVQLPVLSIVLSLSTGEVTRPRSSLMFVLAACTWIRKLVQPMSWLLRRVIV